MTLYQKHVRKWEYCSQCPLGEQRNKIVLARGKIPCDILFIGEAPGASEDVIGKPFVGPAGHLLLSLIKRTVEVSGLSYCLTNLVACFPREAKRGGTNEPPTECVLACANRLREMVRIAKPRAIVLVGKLVSRHIAGEAQFRLDGKPKGVEWLKGKPMLFAEILHPAHILRLDDSQKPLAIRRCVVNLQEITDALQ